MGNSGERGRPRIREVRRDQVNVSRQWMCLDRKRALRIFLGGTHHFLEEADAERHEDKILSRSYTLPPLSPEVSECDP